MSRTANGEINRKFGVGPSVVPNPPSPVALTLPHLCPTTGDVGPRPEEGGNTVLTKKGVLRPGRWLLGKRAFSRQTLKQLPKSVF